MQLLEVIGALVAGIVVLACMAEILAPVIAAADRFDEMRAGRSARQARKPKRSAALALFFLLLVSCDRPPAADREWRPCESGAHFIVAGKSMPCRVRR